MMMNSQMVGGRDPSCRTTDTA